MRKRAVFDAGSTTGPMFVDLYQSDKLNTQTRQSDAVALHPRLRHHQKLANAEGDQAHELPSLTGVGIDRNMGDSRPTKISGPKPHYPIASRRLKEEGEVLVRLCIDSSGEVEKAQIQKSSGYRNLDNSALSALSKWRFLASYQLPNSSVTECFRFPVRFTLES